MTGWIANILLAAAVAAGAMVSPEVLLIVMAVIGGLAMAAGAIARVTPNTTDDKIVKWLEELLAKLSGTGSLRKPK